MEVMKVPVEKEEEKREEIELSLELSIGGNYGKLENNSRGKTSGENLMGQSFNLGISRSDFSCSVGDVGAEENVDLQRRREIQALRRQEARKKREEKIKKSRVRERDDFSEERVRKKDKIIGTNYEVVNDDLKLSLQIEGVCLYPKVQHLARGNNGFFAYNCGVPSFGANVGEGEKNEGNNRSLEQSSSAVSDQYQSTSHKGGSSSDSGTPSRSRQFTSTNAFNHLRTYWELIGKNSKFEKTYFDHQGNNNCSTSGNPIYPPSREKSGSLNDNNNLNAAASVPRVSTTGNGPNGRTITGFLYKYTQTEVSIMCVCHGSSFSPAEFVEHAGGVDVSHPLRHITMIGYS